MQQAADSSSAPIEAQVLVGGDVCWSLGYKHESLDHIESQRFALDVSEHSRNIGIHASNKLSFCT